MNLGNHTASAITSLRSFLKTIRLPLLWVIVASLLHYYLATEAAEWFSHSIFRWVRLITSFLILISVVAVGFRLTDVFCAWASDRFFHAERRSGRTVLLLTQKIFKTVIVALAFLMTLQNFGVNVTALLAGLGVGGIAIALAGQKTLENLFGGIVLLLDQPVRVGDTCRLDGKIAVVEEIGLRSTRLRTLERTVITIPNSNFSQMSIENLREREKFLVLTNLELRYDTTSEQLSRVLEGVRMLLKNHPKTDHKGWHVRLMKLSSSSLTVEVSTYVLTQDPDDYHEIQQGIFIDLLKIVEKSGTRLAYNSVSLYMEKNICDLPQV